MRLRKCKYSATAALAMACVLGMGLPKEASAATQSGQHAVSIASLPGGVQQSVSERASGPDSTAHLAIHARSAAIMDATTGRVLYEKDADESLPMASITKIMTMLLTMEAIDDGRLKWTDEVRTSEHAASMGGSQIFLETGETMSVKDMVKGIAMASANDACVAIAEHLDGSEEAFVARMNRKAKELGMTHTHFSNCNGLPTENHYSSAKDIALMSRALLEHPEITKFTSVYSDYLRKDSEHPLWLVNTNKLVRFYDGVDGLKTGFTQEAKYCLSATAKKDGFRVIAVVMGEPKTKVRNAEVTSMLNWSFSHYKAKMIYPKGHCVAQVNVKKGVAEKVNAITKEPVGFVVERGTKAQYRTEIHTDRLKAPITQGSQIGEIKVYVGDQVVASVPLVAESNVEKANFWQGFGKTIKKVVTFGNA